MKGIELPVNMLVIIAIAVLVLLGLVGMYMAGMLGGGPPMTIQAAKAAACAQMMNEQCNRNPADYHVNYDANGDTKVDSKDNLQLLCNNNLGCGSEATDNAKLVCCKQRVCGCTNIG